MAASKPITYSQIMLNLPSLISRLLFRTLAESDLKFQISGPAVAAVLASLYGSQLNVQPIWFLSSLADLTVQERLQKLLVKLGFEKNGSAIGRYYSYQTYQHPDGETVYLFEPDQKAIVCNELDRIYLSFAGHQQTSLAYTGIGSLAGGLLEQIFGDKVLRSCHPGPMERFYPAEKNSDWIFHYSDEFGSSTHFWTWLTPDEATTLKLFEGFNLVVTGPAVIPILARIVRRPVPLVEPAWFVYWPREPQALLQHLEAEGYFLDETADFGHEYIHPSRATRIIFVKVEEADTIARFDDARFEFETGKPTNFCHRVANYAEQFRLKTLEFNGPDLEMVRRVILEFFRPWDNSQQDWQFRSRCKAVTFDQPRPDPAASSADQPADADQLKKQLVERLLTEAQKMTEMEPLLSHTDQILTVARAHLSPAQLATIREQLVNLVECRLQTTEDPAVRMAAVTRLMCWLQDTA